MIAAGIVLALDDNWFAFTSLTIAFTVVVGVGILVLLRHARPVAESTAAAGAGPTSENPPKQGEA